MTWVAVGKLNSEYLDFDYKAKISSSDREIVLNFAMLLHQYDFEMTLWKPLESSPNITQKYILAILASVRKKEKCLQ